MIVIPAGFKKILIYGQAAAVPEPYGIGYIDLVLFIVRHGIRICLQIIIEDSCVRTHHLFHFHARVPLCPICSHPQG